MTTTINISMPTKMYKQAKKLVKMGKYHSMSEIIRAGLRRVFYDADIITENGMPGWREDRILEAEAQPIKKTDVVWETEEDIDNYFRKLHKKLEQKRNKKDAKNNTNWQVQPVARGIISR